MKPIWIFYVLILIKIYYWNFQIVSWKSFLLLTEIKYKGINKYNPKYPSWQSPKPLILSLNPQNITFWPIRRISIQIILNVIFCYLKIKVLFKLINIKHSIFVLSIWVQLYHFYLFFSFFFSQCLNHFTPFPWLLITFFFINYELEEKRVLNNFLLKLKKKCSQ